MPTIRRRNQKTVGISDIQATHPHNDASRTSVTSFSSRARIIAVGLFLTCMFTLNAYDQFVSLTNITPVASTLPKPPASNSSYPSSIGDAYDPHTDRCVKYTTSRKCELCPCDENGINSNNNTTVSLQQENTDRGFAVRYPEGLSKSNAISMQLAGSAMEGSGCALSRKYGFFFIHNLKGGGTNSKTFLNTALCPKEVPVEIIKDSEHLKRQRQRPMRTRNKRPKIFQCSAGDETLEIVNCSMGLKLAKKNSYFIWSFVRSPFSRLFSGYAMAQGMNQQKAKSGKKIYAKFSFLEFAMAHQRQRQKMSITDVAHYTPQAKFLSDRKNCPIFDYIGRLEHYDDDLLRIINEIEKRHYAQNYDGEYSSMAAGVEVPPTPLTTKYLEYIEGKGRIEANRATSFGAKRKAKMGGEMDSAFSDKAAVGKVYKEYNIDFTMFGYDSEYNP